MRSQPCAPIDTDGRRAKVSFGRDWFDAERRDYPSTRSMPRPTALSDLVGGIADIEARRLRSSAMRKMHPQGHLRIRFFRFFAWYGDGRPDAEGLKACAG